MKYTILLGRVLYSLIFILSSFHHFTQGMIDYAADQGVPMASFLVPLSGVLALAGGLSILIGFKARFGAWLIILFLVPVTFAIHHFWTFTNASEHQIQMIMFMKNISMLGAALMITQLGSGPYSLSKK